MEKREHATNAPLPDKKVLIVDDHPIFRAGLISIVQIEPGLTVSGEAENAAQAIAAIERSQPDIVLMDIGLPDKSGLEALKDIRVMRQELPVLVISMHEESLYAERVIRAGGYGYIMKQAGPDKIMQAIRKVLSGGIYVSEKSSALILASLSGSRKRSSTSPLARLTDREFEVLNLIGQGREPHDIAQHLSLSIKTVDTHRSHIRRKLGLKNGTELIHYAVRWLSGQA